jgi:hypothetical protein
MYEKYCVGDKLETKECTTFCAQNPERCLPSLKSYCVGPNLEKSACIDFCKLTNVNCDEALQNHCSTKVFGDVSSYINPMLGNDGEINRNRGTFNPPPLSSTTTIPLPVDICQCFRKPEFYKNVRDSVENVIGLGPILSLTNPVCYYPPCGESGMLPYNVKQGGRDCPDVVNCIQIGSIDSGGTAGNVGIKQTAECSHVKPDPTEPTAPITPSPPEPIAPPSPPKPIAPIEPDDTKPAPTDPTAPPSKEIRAVNLKVVIPLIAIGSLSIIALALYFAYRTPNEMKRMEKL